MIPIGIPAAWRTPTNPNQWLYNFQAPDEFTERSGLGGLTGEGYLTNTYTPDLTGCLVNQGGTPATTLTQVVTEGAMGLAADWTLDLMIHVSSNTGSTTLIDAADGSTHGWYLRYDFDDPTDTRSFVLTYHTGDYVDNLIIQMSTDDLGTYDGYQHIRLCRSGNTLRLFTGGVHRGSVSVTSSPGYPPTPTADIFRDGIGYSSIIVYAMRLLNGTALSTTNDSFTPLTVPLLPI